MFTVVIAEKEGAERRVTFAESEVTIGRVPGNDVVLPKGNVSKRHSRIVLKDNRFIVVDLKSTNGTYVNGRKITSPLVVKEGDKIYVGDYVLTLESAPALDALKPPSLLPMNTVSDASPPKLGAPRMGREVPTHDVGRETHHGPNGSDDHIPAVLRGTSMSSIPPTAMATPSELARASNGQDEDSSENVDDEEPILAAESELEVFEDRSSREQERPLLADAGAQVFPPPMDDHARDGGVLDGRPPELGEIPRGSPRRPDPLAHGALLGPIETVLADPAVFHVVVERFDRIRADRGEGLTLERVSFSSPEALAQVAVDVRTQAGVANDAASYDVALANGLQVVAVLPAAASNGAVLSVRRRPSHVTSLQELTEQQLLTSTVCARIEEALRLDRHVWIVGAGGVDLAGFVSSALAACPESERLAVFERAPELALGERSAICLKHGVVPIGELLERLRSFRPERLAFHGLREADLPTVLDALAHHAAGCLASFEARSPKDALAAFDRCVGGDLTLRAVSLLVELKAGDDGRARVAAAYDIELDGSGSLALKAH